MNAEFELRPVVLDDVEALFAIYSDARTWTHLPSGRFTEVAQMYDAVQRWLGSWSIARLGPWAVVLDERVVGHVGVDWRVAGEYWNLGFRLDPAVWGRGIARRGAVEGLRQAHQVAHERPVIARSVETNPASARVSEYAGLTEMWRGCVVPGVARVVHADRVLDRALLQDLIELG